MRQVAIPAVLALPVALAFGGSPIVGTFDDDAEGWRRGTVDADGSFTPTGTARHVAVDSNAINRLGGNPGGFLEIRGPYVAAPAEFVGDLSAFAGGTFSFTAWQGVVDTVDAPDDVVIAGPAGTLTYDIPVGEVSVRRWDTFRIRLDASGGWVYDGPFAGQPAGDQIAAVLANVAVIRVRDRLGSAVGPLSRFDTVALMPPGESSTERRKLLPDLATAGSRVGSAVELSNGRVIVGNFSNADGGVFSQGVYVFDAANGTPAPTLVPGRPNGSRGFGFSLSAVGDDVLVGSPLLEPGQPGFDGVSLVFDAATGLETGFFPLPVSERTLSGWSTALTADRAVLASPAGGYANPGLVRVFDRATGAVERELFPDDASSGLGFGLSIDALGDTALIGAPFGAAQGSFGGAAYLFDLSTGQQLMKLRAPDPRVGDDFGWAVALTDTLAIVAAPTRGNDSVSDRGSVFFYDRATGQLVREIVPADAFSDWRFGESLAVDGDTLVVGAGDAGPFENSGAAYVFELSTGVEQFKLVPRDADAGDRFGASVAIEGGRIAVGAPGDDELGADAGAVYVFSATQPCTPSDVAEPLGQLDVEDIDAFMHAFTAGDPLADIDDPFGVLDLEDIDVFITSFLAGCP